MSNPAMYRVRFHAVYETETFATSTEHAIDFIDAVFVKGLVKLRLLHTEQWNTYDLDDRPIHQSDHAALTSPGATGKGGAS